MLVAEALVARLDHVAEGNAVELLRKQVEEAGDVAVVEPPAGGEHPQERPELRPKRRHALGEKSIEALAGIGEPGAGDAKARALDRELEIPRDSGGPGFPAFRALAAVEGGVDLDRAELG